MLTGMSRTVLPGGYSKTVGTQVSPEVLDLMDRTAAEAGVTRSEWIRAAINAALETSLDPAMAGWQRRAVDAERMLAEIRGVLVGCPPG
jgi:Ribbon-helix-helix protein, copG family